MKAIVGAGIFLVLLVGALSLGMVSSMSGKIPQANEPSIVTVENGRLLVDGERFIVKGVTYSPVPPGEDPRSTTYNDWILEPELYHRDFAMMKSAGINTIRLLDMQNNLETRLLFDAADEYHIKIILGVSGPLRNDSSDPEIRAATKREALEMVRAYKGHHAILMWQIGNEVNYWYPQGKDVHDWYTLLEEISAEVKRIDPNHLIITSNSALKDFEDFKTTAKSVDVYGSNQYGLNNGSWEWFIDLYQKSFIRKPFVITEYGADSWDSSAGTDNEESQRRIVIDSWNTMKKSKDFAGAVIFEWSDEWWKSGLPLKQNCERDWQPFDKTSLPDGWFSEECFGIVKLEAGTAKKTPKEVYFDLQKIWPDPDENVPPTISFAKMNESNFEAGVVTYGDVPVDVTLHYKTLFSQWNTVEMEEVGDKHSARIGKQTGILNFRIVAKDSHGRETVESGTILSI